MQPSSQLTLQTAQQILGEFNCQTGKILEFLAEKQRVREALLLVASHSDYQMIGVLAASAPEGLAALRAYLRALGYGVDPNPTAIAGSVYLKFNPRSGRCYMDPYSGEHRGVLVSCQSAYEGGITEMYGHLPLDLFED